MILEALGDFEATAVFREAKYGAATADEADVLFAARVLAMFLLDRENAYTVIPGLLHEYRRIGIDATHRNLSRIEESVRLARQTVRSVLDQDGSPGNGDHPLATIDARLKSAEANGDLRVGDELAGRLIADLRPALRLLQGDSTVLAYPAGSGAAGSAPGNRGLITLTGAGATILN
jgi:hypothetical protein